MSGDKKDLTRIEDLGEFLHELNEEDENESYEPSVDLPDLPEEDAFSSDATETTFEESDTFSSEDTFTSDDNFVSEETFGEEEAFEASTFESEDDTFATSEDEIFEVSNGPEEITEELIEETSNQDDDFLSTLNEVVEEIETARIEDEIYSPPAPASSTPIREYKAPETFSDVKAFAENTNYSGMGAEGNPSFSVLIKNVQFIEDVNDILILLKELNLLIDSEEQIKQRLMRGNLLIPRISEFAAIFLSHKLRKFDVDIQVGLSDEILPPKHHQEPPEIGILSRQNLQQNQSHHFHFDHSKLDLGQIIVSASPNLEGFEVIRYLGVASEHKMISGEIVEEENSDEIPLIYSELAQKLKAHALKANANAIIALNYQLTPLPSEFGVSGAKYRLSCTGNLVWVNKR